MTAVIKAEAKLREKNGGGEYSSDTHQPRVDTHQPPSDDTALLRQALEALRLVPEKRLNEVLYWDEAQSFRAAIAALRERLK
jgi:hypothetical protein